MDVADSLPRRAGWALRTLRRAASRLPRGRARLARALASHLGSPFIDIVEPSALGVPLIVDPADPFQLEIWLGAYQPHVVSFLRRSVRPGDTVLCAGLHVGYVAALARRLAGPAGRVLSAEPDPAARAWGARNLALANGGGWAPVTVLAGGLSDARGRLEMHQSAVMGHSSMASPHQECAVLEVPVVIGDEWLGSVGVRTLDVLVLDVEGWEAHVLEGLRRTIDASPRLCALVEVVEWALRDAGTTPARLIEFWHERGFDVRWAAEHGARHRYGVWGPPASGDEPAMATDVLCVRDPS